MLLLALPLGACDLFSSGAPAATDAAAPDVVGDTGPCGALGQPCCVARCNDPSLLCEIRLQDPSIRRLNHTCVVGIGAPCEIDLDCTYWNRRAICRLVGGAHIGGCLVPPSPCGGHGEACCLHQNFETCNDPSDVCRGRCCGLGHANCARNQDCCTGYCAGLGAGSTRGNCEVCDLAPAGHPCRGPQPPAPDSPCAHTTCPTAYDCRYPQRDNVVAHEAFCCHDDTPRVDARNASASCWTRAGAIGCGPMAGVEVDPGVDQGVCRAVGPIVCAWPTGRASCPALWTTRAADGLRIYANGCCYAGPDGAPLCGLVRTPGCSGPTAGEAPVE